MFTFLFPQLLWTARIPGHEELKKLFNQNLGELGYFEGDWGCSVKTSFGKEAPNEVWQRYAQCLEAPIQEMFAALQLGANVEAVISQSWRNLYNRGDFQAVHSHDPADFSLVYFVNYDAEKDAKLCIFNQHKGDVQFLNKYQSNFINQYDPSCYVLSEIRKVMLLYFRHQHPTSHSYKHT